MILKLREELRGASHVHVTFFVGTTDADLANAGTLVFAVGEWHVIGEALALGAHNIEPLRGPLSLERPEPLG